MSYSNWKNVGVDLETYVTQNFTASSSGEYIMLFQDTPGMFILYVDVTMGYTLYTHSFVYLVARNELFYDGNIIDSSLVSASGNTVTFNAIPILGSRWDGTALLIS